jgi:hypothetical protein
MYTLEYRYRQDNGRLTRWFFESRHETRDEAKQALGAHVAKFFSMNARVTRETGEVLGEYKYSR